MSRAKWLQDGCPHRLGRTAVIKPDPTTDAITRNEWWKDGGLDRADGPAIIKRDTAIDTVILTSGSNRATAPTSPEWVF
jgi:hypothetical protein